MDNLNPQGDDIRGGAYLQQPAPSKDLGRFCLACAQHGRTCCQGHDIYITRGDCGRINHYTQVANFYGYRGYCHADYADQGDDPIWQQYVFRRGGSRRVLKRPSEGDCIFLGPVACCLPLTVRPLICRLYTRLYSASGIADAWDGECAAAKTLASQLVEAGIAGVQLQKAAQWHRMLCSEILWENNSNENRLNL